MIKSDFNMQPIACIVLPTYNEAQNISKLLPDIFKQSEKISSHELHVLVVDDNSPDGTGDIVKKKATTISFSAPAYRREKGIG